jgi:hypothetical protein
MKGAFVYASAEIAVESARRDRLDDSLLTEKASFNLTRYTAFNLPAPRRSGSAIPAALA